MRGHPRDVNIGIPPDKTLNDVYSKLGVLEAKLKENKDVMEEAVEEQRKLTLGVGVITGVDLDEEER